MINPKAENIIEQTRRLYKRYGIKSVTMDDVAHHLCISKKTLYEFFKDKEDLVEKVMMAEYDDLISFFRSLQSKELNAVEALLEVYKELMKFYRQFNPSIEYDIKKYYPDLYSKIKSIRRQNMYNSTLQNLEKGKKEGLYRAEIDSVILAKLHVFRSENLLDGDLFSMEEITSVQVFHEIFVYHLNGLLTEKGRKFFLQNFEKFRTDLL